MRIEFEVEGQPVAFERDQFTGRAELIAGGERIPLASPTDPSTHFSLSLTRVFRQHLWNHQVVVEITRPVLLAGFRPNRYRVWVDDKFVAEQTGT